MKIATLINARLGSKRLPKKHLRDIAGKLAIEQLIARIKPCGLPIIIATGDEKENKALDAVARSNNVEIFFGDQNNIPNRHLQIARKYNLDAIISVDADDILTSLTALNDTILALKEEKLLVRTEGLPLGMNVLWAYTAKTLINAIQNAKGDGSYDTGWGWIFNEPHRINYTITDAKKIRATLDFPEDLKFFRHVYEECPINELDNDDDLCRWIISNKAYVINKKRCTI